jgi:hypothetical protein
MVYSRYYNRLVLGLYLCYCLFKHLSGDTPLSSGSSRIRAASLLRTTTMREKELLKMATERILRTEDGVVWTVRTGHDIFGIFDIIYLGPLGDTSYFQVSTVDHKWQRSTKINEFKKTHGALPSQSYLMLWDYQSNDWKIEQL